MKHIVLVYDKTIPIGNSRSNWDYHRNVFAFLF